MMLSSLKHSHGALTVSCTATENVNVLDTYVDCVLRCLDAYSISWAPIVAHGIGAFAALRMSYLFPERVGSIAIVDTPVVTRRHCTNYEIRSEVLRAGSDVNIHSSLIEKYVAKVMDNVEEVLPSTTPSSAADDVFLRSLVPKGFDASDSYSRFLNPRQVAEIRHPIHIAIPSAAALSDLDVHKEIFNLRRLQTVKTANSHQELFTCGAPELANGINAFLARYDMDVVIHRRYEQASATIRKKFETTADKVEEKQKPEPERVIPKKGEKVKQKKA